MERSRTAILIAAAFLIAAAPTLSVLQDHRDHVHKEHARTVAAAAQSTAAVPDERLSDIPCKGGEAGPFACDGIDLLGFVPATEFAGPETDLLTSDDFGPDGVAGISDIWGWTDPDSGDEYVILGKTNGVGFFRVTDPTAPEYLGELPNTSAVQLTWHDIKVHDDHAFIVSESEGHGMQVFDLKQLRSAAGDSPQIFAPTSHYPFSGSAHNLAINEDSGFAYILGGSIGVFGQEPCSLHIVDVRDPAVPTPAGCWAGERGQFLSLRGVQYVHDAQCVIYDGPDDEHDGKEICFASNEINLSIVDVTDKTDPVLLGQLEYTDVAYAHQGWLSEDQASFFLGDELDERDFGLPTRTIVFDVQDLDAPAVHFDHLHDTVAIDHNMYVDGPLLYQSNYTAGLRVLDTTGVADGTLSELAYFDTYPADDDEPITGFHGTWSNYPYFESGTIAVSGIDEGLFLLRLQDKVFNHIGKTSGGGGEGGPSTTPPLDRGNRTLTPQLEEVFFAIQCITEGEDPRCVSTNFALSTQPGDNSVANVAEATPLNEAFHQADRSALSRRYAPDETMHDAYSIRTDDPLEGQVTIRSFGGVGTGLTTVEVDIAGKDADGQRIDLANATVTQPVLPGSDAVFAFSVELDSALDGVVVHDLFAEVTVRGFNVLTGFTDGEGGSFFHLPHQR